MILDLTPVRREKERDKERGKKEEEVGGRPQSSAGSSPETTRMTARKGAWELRMLYSGPRPTHHDPASPPPFRVACPACGGGAGSKK